MMIKHISTKYLSLWIGLLSLAYPLFAFGQNAESASFPRPDKKQIILRHADMIEHDQERHPDVQCLIGNVELQHKDMYLFCDSAALNQKLNTFEAFGSVHMLQGDTLSLNSDYLFYNGDTEIAEVRYEVMLSHRETILTTDSLNYDNIYKLAYFFEGGRLVNGADVLTSDWGEYHTDTRKATFNYDVVLRNKDFTLTSDTLHYNTQTKWANVMGPSNIESGDNHIFTTRGYYNTELGLANLLDRPVLFNQGKRMEGDSLYYEKNSGMIRALRNIEFEDTENKNILLGEYCEYNELTGDAMATGRALVKEFSEADTLFMHADTLRLKTPFFNTDSAYRIVHAYPHVRAYRTDVQAVCDTLIFDSKLRQMFLRLDPIVWSDARQILGEEIIVFSNDSTLDSIYVERQALTVEQVDSVHFNQVGGQRMIAYFANGKLSKTHVDGNVCVVNFPLEKDSTVLYMNYTETSHLRMYMKDGKFNKLLGFPEARGKVVPLPLILGGMERLSNFNWFDYIRPLSKHDLFEWRGKKKGTELKPSLRREAPVQKL